MRFLKFALFSILVVFSSNCLSKESRIAAVVNNKMITVADLESRITLAILSSGMENSPEIYQHLKPQVLKVMIEEMLKLQEAEKYEIQIPEENIKLAFADIEKNNNMQEGELKKLLETNEIAQEIMNEHIRANLSWREFVREKYHSNIQIGEAEIDRALQEIEESKSEPRDLVAEIFLAVDDQSQEKEVKKQAEELLQNLKQGARFSVLAQQFSNAASAARGGDIGWVRQGSFETSLRKALENLPVGSVTEPIRAQNGYYLLMLRDQKRAGESAERQTLVSFKQLLIPLAPSTSQEQAKAALSKAAMLTQNAKTCGLFSKLAQADKVVKFQDAKDVPLSGVMPQLQEILTKLNIEEPSPPILSDIGVLVFMVCERKDIDPQAPTRDEMRALLVEKKLNLLAQRELRNLHRAAYIDIRA
jgi:peptidyl-prolyl cis-trans isomerase SurA